MSGVPWWQRPVIELPLSGREVSRCCFNNALRLYFSDSDGGYRPPDWWGDPATAAGEVRVAIEREFRLGYLGRDRKLSPEGDLEELGTAVVLYRKVVHRALAYRDGRLEVRFRDGTHIWVPSHPEYEPWRVEGPAGLLVVSVPGAELAIWAPRGETGGERAT